MHVSCEHQGNIQYSSQGLMVLNKQEIETILIALETPLLIANVIFSVFLYFRFFSGFFPFFKNAIRLFHSHKISLCLRDMNWLQCNRLGLELGLGLGLAITLTLT